MSENFNFESMSIDEIKNVFKTISAERDEWKQRWYETNTEKTSLERQMRIYKSHLV